MRATSERTSGYFCRRDQTTAFNQNMFYVDVERDMIMDGESCVRFFLHFIHDAAAAYKHGLGWGKKGG